MRVNQVTGYTTWPLDPPLLEFVEKFQSVFHEPDPGALLVTLATYAAFRLPGGNPLWTMIVGGPSTGKTELINLISELPGVYARSELTRASLLSGSKKKEWTEGASGGLLMEISANGGAGLLVFKDFTTTLGCTNSHDRQFSESSVLGMLRELQDGSFTRGVGTEGSRTLDWRGKLGVIAACTSVIDDYRSVMSAMGDRFIFYRMAEIPDEHKEAVARRARLNVVRDLEQRAALSEAAASFLANIPAEWPVNSDGDYENCIDSLAVLVAQCRSQVGRDKFERTIDHKSAPEGPGRVSGQFTKLDAGLKLIGVPPIQRYQLVRKTAFYSIPDVRLALLTELARFGSPKPGGAVGIEKSALVERTMFGETTVRRTLEDMRVHGIVEREGAASQYWWRMSRCWLDRWNACPEGSCISNETGQVVQIAKRKR